MYSVKIYHSNISKKENIHGRNQSFSGFPVNRAFYNCAGTAKDTLALRNIDTHPVTYIRIRKRVLTARFRVQVGAVGTKGGGKNQGREETREIKGGFWARGVKKGNRTDVSI